MTLSEESRARARHELLVRLHCDLAGRSFDAVRFGVREDAYRDVPQTTRLELESAGWLVAMHFMGNPGYRLTGRGWLAALKNSGEDRTEQHRDAVIALRAALKDVVKGRPLQGAVTSLRDLHAATGLANDWISNALQSRLLQSTWPDDHLDVDLTNGLRAVRVPARFGMRRLDGLAAGPFSDP